MMVAVLDATSGAGGDTLGDTVRASPLSFRYHFQILVENILSSEYVTMPCNRIPNFRRSSQVHPFFGDVFDFMDSPLKLIYICDFLCKRFMWLFLLVFMDIKMHIGAESQELILFNTRATQGIV